MRVLVSVVLLALLVAGGAPAFRAAAQQPTLRDLLPTAEEVGAGFVAVENRTRALSDQATGFGNAADAARRLQDWDWQENAFRVFQSAAVTHDGAPAATVDISLTRFASAADAAGALPYFLQDRAAVLGEQEIPNPGRIGDEARAIDGQVAGGYDLTLFVRSGPLLIRVSATSAAGSPATAPDRIAREIVARAAGQPAPVLLAQGAATYLPRTLPLADADCFRVDGEGELDPPALVERLAGLADAAATLAELGWQEGVFRQFACDAPPGRAGWVDVSVSRFRDAGAAADAVPVFAGARAAGMKLDPAKVEAIGDSRAAIAGPAVNGREYTLYLSSGPLLFAVTGVAPSGDPRPDVEAIATALYDTSLAGPTAQPETISTTIPVDVPPAAAAAPTTPPAPTIAPMATASPLPTATPIPPATLTPTPIPAPTETPVPDTIPVQVPEGPPPAPTATATPPPLPTASAGAPPTPTPRVIHPPTPAGG